MALEQKCWRRGTVPVSTWGVGADDLLGGGGGVGLPMPYRTDTYSVSEARVIEVMGSHPSYAWDYESIRRIGIREYIDDKWETADDCHTQGITMCSDNGPHTKVVTSCMTRGVFLGDNNQKGFLQFYEYNGIHDFATDYQDAENGGSGSLKVLEQPWPHAVVGQSVKGIGLTDDLGNLNADFGGKFLFPVGSETAGNPTDLDFSEVVQAVATKANVRLYDQNGVWLEDVEYWHPVQYTCGALFHYTRPNQDEPELFLFFIDNNDPSFTLLRYIWDRNLRRFTGVEPLVDRENYYNNILKEEYQAINFFYGFDIETGTRTLYLVATHDRWMDTYKLSIDELNVLEFNKIANTKYPGLMANGLFYEGVCLQQLDDKRMRVWCAPWDYKDEWCLAPPQLAKCTYLWYFFRQF